MENANKTTAEVVGEYDPKWAVVNKSLDVVLEDGENDLGRIVDKLDREFLTGGDNPERQNKFRLMQRQDSFILNDQVVKKNGMSFFDAVAIADTTRIRPVIDCCKSDSTRVVELASGWGKHLFKIFLNGGPKNGRYFACDINESALAAANKIRESAAEAPDLTTVTFDLKQPDFSALSEAEPTVVYTNYGFEQIAEVSPDLIEAIRNIPGLQYCVHSEPIAWQIPFPAQPFSVDWYQRKQRDRRQRQINLRVKHNMNLFPLLKSFEARGAIKIEDVRRNISCPHGWNPASLVIWSPA